MKVMLVFNLLINLGYQVILFKLSHGLLVIFKLDFIVIVINFDVAI